MRTMIPVLASALILPMLLFCSHDLRGKDGGRYSQETGGSRLLSGADKKEEAIKSIHLKRRNWENNGTDTFIRQDGRFEVYAYAFGESKSIREGLLDRETLGSLASAIRKADFFRLPEEYKAPFKSEVSWWGYELTIESDQGRKTVRYHSEDDQVPDALKNLVKRILELSR